MCASSGFVGMFFRRFWRAIREANIFAQPLHAAGVKPRLGTPPRAGSVTERPMILTCGAGSAGSKKPMVSSFVAEEFCPHRPVFGRGEDVHECRHGRRTDPAPSTMPQRLYPAAVAAGPDAGRSTAYSRPTSKEKAAERSAAFGMVRRLRASHVMICRPVFPVARSYSCRRRFCSQLPGDHGGVVKGQVAAGEQWGRCLRKEAPSIPPEAAAPQPDRPDTATTMGRFMLPAKPRDHVTAVDLRRCR